MAKDNINIAEQFSKILDLFATATVNKYYPNISYKEKEAIKYQLRLKYDDSLRSYIDPFRFMKLILNKRKIEKSNEN